jgi:ubiquitin-activating enzyme E1
LSSQFFLSEADVGKNRAEACKKKLFELNERVQIQVLPQETSLTEELIKSFTVVILTENHSREELLRINSICHNHNIAFLAGGVWGLFGWAFADFGEFHCIDPDGEPPKTAYIAGITQDKEGVISVVDNKRHDLADGDRIRVSEIQGMTELNGREIIITDKGPYQIGIGDTSQFSPYINKGFIEQVKVPVKHQFKPLVDFFGKICPPDLIILGDFSKFDRTDKYLWFLQGLLAFQEKHKRLPIPGSQTEAKEVVALAEGLSKEQDPKSSFDESTTKWMSDLAKGAMGVSPQWPPSLGE